VFVLDEYEPARRCAARCAKVVLWPDDAGERCPKCGGELTESRPARRRRWSSGFDTRREAEAALRAALNRMDTGADAFPPAITVGAFVEGHWLPHLEAQNKPRPPTRWRYASLWRSHLRPVLGALRLDRVRPAHVQDALDRMLAHGAAPRSAAQARAVMSSAFRFAVRSSLLSANPVRETSTPTPAQPDLTVPNGDQLRALIEAARGTTWEIPVLLAATTGARRGECLAFRWDHADLDRGRLGVRDAIQRRRGGDLEFVRPKTARAKREVPVPGFVVERLREHRIAQTRRRLMLGAGWTDLDLICDRGDGKPFDPDSFTHGFGRIAESVGMPGVRLHDCRHGVATEMARRGVSPTVTSRVLGHSSEAFTMSVYQHPDDAMLDAAADALADVFSS
jgi:integrase